MSTLLWFFLIFIPFLSLREKADQMSPLLAKKERKAWTSRCRAPGGVREIAIIQKLFKENIFTDRYWISEVAWSYPVSLYIMAWFWRPRFADFILTIFETSERFGCSWWECRNSLQVRISNPNKIFLSIHTILICLRIVNLQCRNWSLRNILCSWLLFSFSRTKRGQYFHSRGIAGIEKRSDGSYSNTWPIIIQLWGCYRRCSTSRKWCKYFKSCFYTLKKEMNT